MTKSESGLALLAFLQRRQQEPQQTEPPVKSHLSNKPGLCSDALCENMTFLLHFVIGTLQTDMCKKGCTLYSVLIKLYSRYNICQLEVFFEVILI